MPWAHECPRARCEKCPSEGGWVVWLTWSIPRLRLQSLLDEANWAGQESRDDDPNISQCQWSYDVIWVPISWFFMVFQGGESMWIHSPLSRRVGEVKPWSYVFTSICAIIGGVFSVATLVWTWEPSIKNHKNLRLKDLFRCFLDLDWIGFNKF